MAGQDVNELVSESNDLMQRAREEGEDTMGELNQIRGAYGREPISPGGPEQEQEAPDNPELRREVEGFCGAISKMLHGKETKGKIYEMLKSAPPDKSIPEAVFQTNIRVAEKLRSKGKNPSMEALFSGVVFATSELAEIGNAGRFFKDQELDGESIKPVLQASLQRMVVEGVKRKLIDPVEFQQKIEPLLNEEQRSMGLQAAQRSGIPAEAGEHVAMERYAMQAVDKDRSMRATKESAQARKGMLQQAQGGQ